MIKSVATFAAVLLASTGGAAWAQTQDTPSPVPLPTPDSDDDNPPDDRSEGTIIVTGSRIARADYVSQSPIVTVTSDALQLVGPAGTVDQGLSQLPQFTPTAGATASFPNRLGQALLNLRGLGANRMLVLLDGRRIQPSAPDGSVDVNLIPTGLIQTVETITGGASAIYGSDAITGVVNFKLLNDFDGVKLSVQETIPNVNTGSSFNANGVFGTSFGDDRGSLVLSLDYTDRKELKANQRPFYVVTRSNTVLPLATVNFGGTLPNQVTVNQVFAKYGIASGAVLASRPIGVNYDGTLFSPNPVVNYNGPINDDFFVFNGGVINSAGRSYALQTPLKRYNAYVRGEYEFDAFKIFGSFLYNNSLVDVNISTIGLGQIASANVSVPVTNPFIPADLRTLLDSRTNRTAPFAATYLLDSMPGVQFKTKGEIYQAMVGAEGELFSDWSWNAYGTVGQTKTNQRITGFSLVRAQQLLSAPDGGNSLCQGGLNIFGPPSAISQACQDYIFAAGVVDSAFDQAVASATVQGPLFSLPAGDVITVLGLEYRRNEFASNPSANFQAGDVVPQGVILPAAGSQSVREVFTEVLIPILKDFVVAESLNLDLGYRFSDYSTFGGVSTYKADIDWAVAGGLMLRGGYSRALRAPSLADLFTPAALTSVALGSPGANNRNGDPCDTRSSYRLGPNGQQVAALCVAQGVPSSIIGSYTFTNTNVFPVITGNPNLQPETADTYTAGLVWRSPFSTPFLRRFYASVDYYNIAVTDAIGTVPFLNALQNCFNADNVSNTTYSPGNIFCSGIVRNSLGQITQDSRAATLNLAAYKTEGIDAQVDWRIGLDEIGLGEGAGALTLNFVGTRLLKFVIQNFTTAPALDFAGSSQGSITFSVLPKWKSVTSLSYEKDGASLGVRWRYIGAVQDVSRVTTVGSTTPGVDAVHYFDINAKYVVEAPQPVEVRAGVSNVFDREIPQVGAVPGTTDPTTYDIIGRTFYVGATIRL